MALAELIIPWSDLFFSFLTMFGVLGLIGIGMNRYKKPEIKIRQRLIDEF